MNRKLALGLCLAAAAVSTPAAAQQAQPRWSSLTVFGDSLVDAGNIRALGLGANPAQGYFQGRFTNGYDYTDLISIELYGTPTTASLLGGTNFAYGGARATTTSAVPDLTEQLGQYGAYLAGGGRVDPTGLYVLNFGGNDVFAAQNSDQPGGFANDGAFLRNAATTYADGVQRLYDLGARNFLITGFPVATGDGLALSLEAEAYLSAALGGLSIPQAGLYRYSYLDFFGRVSSNPAAFGLPADLIYPVNGRPETTCRGAGLPAGCAGYFSFDGVHPTAAIHRAAFDDLNRQFNITAPVPEPATWAMLIMGFGLVAGAMRYRRRGVRVAFAA